MKKQDVYKDMEATLGVVPEFMKAVPENTLDLEWDLMKKVQMEEGAIPNKYRELIGLGISAVIKCKYCIYFHTEMAKLNGATAAEIEDALHYAKSSVGWSTYISGLQTDFEQFKKDIRKACDFARQQQKTPAKGKAAKTKIPAMAR